MKERSLFVTSWIVILAICLSNLKALAANDAYFSEFTLQIINRLNRNCATSARINYRSQKLTTPDRLTSVHFEGTLTRAGQRGIPAAPNGLCLDGKAQTPLTTMILQSRTGVQRINLISLLSGRSSLDSFYIHNPISWSPDSRYLIVRVDNPIPASEIVTEHVILDSRNNYRRLSIAACNNAPGGALFLGFRSATAAIFRCDGYGSPDYFETVDIQRRTARRINNPQDRGRLRAYGTVSSPAQIISNLR